MLNNLNIKENVLLVRVSRLYRKEMSPIELYEITRGVWKIGVRKEKVDFVFSIFDNKIIAVYKVDSWHSAYSTIYETRTKEQITLEGEVSLINRFEFIGSISKELESKYLGKEVNKYFLKGNANPIKYINC